MTHTILSPLTIVLNLDKFILQGVVPFGSDVGDLPLHSRSKHDLVLVKQVVLKN